MTIDLSKMPKLGFGMMRLPVSDGQIDHEQVCRMVDLYMDAGLTYFDTAYPYHGGESEKEVKKAIVDRYPRDSFTIATKLPAWKIENKDDRDRIFNEQLEKTGAGYFDFYLLHSITRENYHIYDENDCFNWGFAKRDEGLIKHFGFSFHADPELLIEILDKYPGIEFVQIQLNYFDWDSDTIYSGKLYDILHERNIPIVVMEPIKGGSLASLRPELETKLKEVDPDASIASWALRYVGSLDGVMTLLSGMSLYEQMEDNVKTFTDFKPLNETERKVLDEVVKEMKQAPQIGCTACSYCTEGCPMHIAIPKIFKVINNINMYGDNEKYRKAYEALLAENGKASDCIQCGQCEGACPQHLSIIKLLQNAAQLLD